MTTASQIREELIGFLAQEKSLDAFEEWFARNTWNIHKDKNIEAEDLAGAIELCLAEYSSGHLNDQELRAKLSRFVANREVAVSFGPRSGGSAQPRWRATTTSSVHHQLVPAEAA